MHEDIISRTAIDIALNTQILTADTTTLGEVIDTQGYDSLMLTMKLGVRVTGDITITSIKEADVIGMTSATEVPSTNLYGNTLAGTILDTSNTKTRIGVVAHKRFMRPEYTTANTADLTVSSSAIKGNADIATY